MTQLSQRLDKLHDNMPKPHNLTQVIWSRSQFWLVRLGLFWVEAMYLMQIVLFTSSGATNAFKAFVEYFELKDHLDIFWLMIIGMIHDVLTQDDHELLLQAEADFQPTRELRPP